MIGLRLVRLLRFLYLVTLNFLDGHFLVTVSFKPPLRILQADLANSAGAPVPASGHRTLFASGNRSVWLIPPLSHLPGGMLLL